MAAQDNSPQIIVRRRARILFVGILLGMPASGLIFLGLVRDGFLSPGYGVGLFAAVNFVFSLSLVGLMVRSVEFFGQSTEDAEVSQRTQVASLESRTASLQNEVTERGRALEDATANLRVATKVNALLALCAQHMPSGVIIADGAGQILWANQAWEKLSGWSQADSARQQVDLLLSRVWDGFETVRGREILRLAQPATIETHATAADGGLRWMTIAFQPVRNSQHEVVNFIVIIDDITADRQMRETLRVAEERLKLALTATDESVWDWNIETGQIYRDQRWSELIGTGPEETAADMSEWTNRVHPDDIAAAQGALDAHLQGRAPLYLSEHRLRTRSGQWIWTLDRGRVVSRDRDGRPLRMVGTQGDITGRKKLDERLRHSEEISIQVGRLAQIGAWELQIASQEMRWEPELFRIAEVELGYAPTLAKMTDLFLNDGNDDFTQSVEHAVQDGRSFDIECPFVTAQGQRRWVRVFGQAEFKEGRAERLFGAVQDITARHEADEAHRKLESQLFQVQKMETLGTMAGGIAHDFNNLLTGIIGFQDLALDSIPEDDPARHCLSEARNACLRACELVDQILVFSRQSGSSKHSPVDVASVLEEARRFLRFTIPATIQIEVTIEPECGHVLGDATQINQVLLNLCSNAAHAMRDTGGVLSIALKQMEMDATQASAAGNLPAGDYLRLSVMDTGYGMNAETQRRIFDPFFTTKSAGEGTGLGLAIVHGIVRGHGGAIEVKSAPGEGTTIHVYLPVARVEGAEIDEPVAPPPRGNGEMIWIVDDEQIVGQAARFALERFGYRTVVYNNPDQCLMAVRQQPDGCAVLVSDQTMPGMTGMELSVEVRKLALQLPIIIMSGYFSKVSPGALEQIGHIALLAKPFTPVELTAAVDRALHPKE